MDSGASDHQRLGRMTPSPPAQVCPRGGAADLIPVDSKRQRIVIAISEFEEDKFCGDSSDARMRPSVSNSGGDCGEEETLIIKGCSNGEICSVAEDIDGEDKKRRDGRFHQVFFFWLRIQTSIM
jgi:hypothetical protein